MTVIYEVNLFVQRNIEADYRLWLKKHIADILVLPGFIGAEKFDVQQEGDDNHAAICVQYRLQSQAALNDYLEQHAPRLRAEGIAKFGEHFRATRRVLVLQ
jgi:antibiotic biosynthesis monooxygenase (ABM) superfamily enzyme